MKNLIVFLVLVAAESCMAVEDCSHEAIGIEPSSTEIEKLFYTGTCHYRNENYPLAVENWEHIAHLDIAGADDEGLKVDVLNNLGYMKFFGYGIKEDKAGALSYWRQAILLGHYESEYHLCHAYADNEQPTFDAAKGRKHCEKARLIYKGKDDSDPEILEQIDYYLEKISK